MLAALEETAASWLTQDPSTPIALVGDWNIAPTDDDVWDVEFYQAAPTSPRQSARRSDRSSMPDSPMWSALSPPPDRQSSPTGTTRSCGSRRTGGMRIDFILGSPALAERVTHAEIVREERKGKQPSDHAPVLVELTDA